MQRSGKKQNPQAAFLEEVPTTKLQIQANQVRRLSPYSLAFHILLHPILCFCYANLSDCYKGIANVQGFLLI